MADTPEIPPLSSVETGLVTARRTLYALVGRLPEELRAEVLRSGYQLCDRSKRDRDGDETLGTYDRFNERITIHVEAILERCQQESLNFEREIEITFLHELGHHLGLEEDALVKRGL